MLLHDRILRNRTGGRPARSASAHHLEAPGPAALLAGEERHPSREEIGRALAGDGLNSAIVQRSGSEAQNVPGAAIEAVTGHPAASRRSARLRAASLA